MAELGEEIERRFKYHAPSEDQIAVYNALREKAKELALLITELVPESREQSLALTDLERALMMANAGVARRTSFFPPAVERALTDFIAAVVPIPEEGEEREEKNLLPRGEGKNETVRPASRTINFGGEAPFSISSTALSESEEVEFGR